jgi:outer membrane protein
MRRPHNTLLGRGGLSAALLVAAAGCAGSPEPRPTPFYDQTAADLRRSVIETADRELRESSKTPAAIVTTRDEGSIERLGILPDVIPELQEMAGPDSYRSSPPLTFPTSLTERPPTTVVVSLERMVRTAVERNVAIEFARVGPAVAEAQVVAAEAAFDWVFFSNLNYVNTDSPRVAAFAGSSTTEVSEAVTNTTGVRRTLLGGGRLTAQTEISYTDNDTRGQVNNPNPAEQLAITLQYDQPLLRNFGSEVSQAEIRVARNAERNSIHTLRRDIIRVVTDVERTYWQLVQSYYDVRILERLLDRGERVQEQLRQRVNVDANRAQIADATARVERRRADVYRARAQLRIVSDRLKTLVNDPEFPTGSEVVLVPADDAVDEPVRFSLAESLRAALRHRPEVQQAVLSIDDASIRQTVARNARLPDLSLRLQSRFVGLDNDYDSAASEMFEGSFIDYLAGLAFEVPIGNRRGEAEYRRRMLERTQSVLAYRNTVQGVVSEVRSALIRLNLNYILISQTMISRLAASEVLRVLNVEKEVGQGGFNVERLDLELRKQEELAAAEREEVQALIEYNSTIAEFFQSMGTTLERNNIKLVIPSGEDVLWGAEEDGERPFPDNLPPRR